VQTASLTGWHCKFRPNTEGADRFSFNANVSERDLEDYFYPPFEACIDNERGNSAGAMCSDCAQNGIPSCASELLMTQKPKDWNASDDFFVVSDMGSYYNVYAKHHYSANTSDALLTDLHAGLDILYLRGGPSCLDKFDTSTPGCPDNARTSQQANETHDAFEAATNGSHPDARFTLKDLDTKAGTALRLRFDLGVFDAIVRCYFVSRA
jgi:beta-glucosidase-like glycosyl hydrolase